MDTSKQNKGEKRVKINININYVIGIVLTKGTKRLHFYRNQYGVEAGVNIIPHKFGIFTYVSHGVKP